MSRGVTAAGSFVLSVQLARQLPLDDFGRFSFCQTLLVALTMVARYGCDFSLLKFAGAAWHGQDSRRFADVCRYALGLTSRISTVLSVICVAVLWIALVMGWATASTMLITIVGLIPMTLIYVISSCFKSAHRSQIGA